MPTNIVEERERWVLPLVNKEVKLKDLVKVCSHSGRSLKRWLAAYKKNGRKGLEPKSTSSLTQIAQNVNQDPPAPI